MVRANSHECWPRQDSQLRIRQQSRRLIFDEDEQHEHVRDGYLDIIEDMMINQYY